MLPAYTKNQYPVFNLGLEFFTATKQFDRMTEDAPEKDQKTRSEKARSADKQARLSEALRANLRRRKDQARVRKQSD